MRKNQKTAIIVGLAAILALVTLASMLYLFSKNNQKPEEQWKQYISLLKQGQYEQMYAMLTKQAKENINQEDFITRNQNIYEGIGATGFEVTIKEVAKEKEKATIVYTLAMNTDAGPINVDNNVTLVKEEKQYKVEWASKDIFPVLTKEDKVRVKTITAQRGTIYDRNQKVLAGKGVASSIGLVPGKMNENKEQDIAKMAELLNVTAEKIQSLLKASYVKDDTFVPIKTVAKTEQALKDSLLQIKGIKIVDTTVRIYPYGEQTSQLLGYTQNINAEELEQLKEKGYHTNSVIGKSGIEKEFEDRLRAIDGCQIMIVDAKGNVKQELAKQEAKNGEDITLTMDSTLQGKIYEQFKKDKSCEVAMNSQTGEILALVSTPTFDSNSFSMGITSNEWNRLSTDENKPLYNRYKATWAPGSSFKPIIGAIGVTTGKLNPEENFGKSGTSWQKDSSWGAYKITTLTQYGEPVNLRSALIHSDNIYFAKTALKIGKDTLTEQLKKLGFGEELPFEETLSKSTFGTDGTINSEIELADSGYGQGKILVNPIHMASMYTSFINEGNMVKPYLEYKENPQKEYWKESVFTKEAAETIKQDLIQVVEDIEGTAHSAKISGKEIAGKTGTAEIKTSKEDENGTELGWFNAFTTRDTNNPLLIISMVEEVKDRGGSHYLLPKIKTIFQ